jgi:chromate transporter
MADASEHRDAIAPPEFVPNYSLWQMVQYALKLGSIGFGGPIALVGYMHRDLVEDRQWISESEYSEGMTLAQVAPGPLAAQLAIYLGYVHYGLLGASLVGIAFVLPSFFMVVALGWAYMRYGGLSWMQAVFYGVGACAIGIIALSAYKLTVKIVKGPLLWGIFAIATAVTAIRETEEVLLILGAGILVWLVKAPPKNWFNRSKLMGINLSPLILLAQTGAPAADANLLLSIFLFFAQAGSFVFGSGLAIVPFLYGGVVKNYHWLTDKQFVDAVAVAMITPGPVVITVGFVGYLVAGLAGATVAALATFLPCYLITVLAAPYFKKHGKQRGIAAFVNGVTVAATGAIVGAVFVLGRKSIIDIPTALIALVTLALLWYFKKKLPEPIVVVAAALIGLIIYPFTHAQLAP